jgi:hypothetical protein
MVVADMLSDLRRGESKGESIVLEPFRNVCIKNSSRLNKILVMSSSHQQSRVSFVIDENIVAVHLIYLGCHFFANSSRTFIEFTQPMVPFWVFTIYQLLEPLVVCITGIRIAP